MRPDTPSGELVRPDARTTSPGDDLHVRAAFASRLSFTISDPRLPDDPLIWVNPAFEQVTGYSAEESLGRNCRFLQGPGTDRAAVARVRAALDEGRTAAETFLNYRKDGTPFWNALVISPVVDPDGTITHHVGIQTDVTPRMEMQQERDAALQSAREVGERLTVLAEVSETLSRHLDDAEALRALADVLVPRLADWGWVALADDHGRVEQLHVSGGPEHDEDAAALQREHVSWLTRAPAVMAALRGQTSADAGPYPIDVEGLPGRTTPEQLAILRRLGLGEAIVVPMRGRDGVIGVLCLVNGPDRRFTPQEVATVEDLSVRAGVGLDNARLYARERSAALTLQRTLLPEIGHVDGLDISASYLPAADRAEVGGDWFDVLPLPDGAVGLAVGDVVGHDLRAAAAMGQLRSVLRSHAWSGARAGQVLGHLDELVRGLGMADLSTCVYLRLEPDARLTYSSAGHPPALIRLPGGAVVTLDGALSPPIGVHLSGAPTDAEAHLPHGAVLVVYTDGLVERRGRSLTEGIADLAEALAAVPDGMTAADVRDRLVGSLLPDHHEDDVCLLVVRRP